MSRKHTTQQCGSFRAQVPDAHLVNAKKKKKNQNRDLLVGNDKGEVTDILWSFCTYLETCTRQSAILLPF